ncbi:ABC transporter permease [Lederbergia wuyishanensis]|uniref:Aldouronate transport system permease protein n=1 Tax=Lederbergia wuyishanensis TaxID=1347903 RepID=A0ABU0D5Y1_9BACI|nr:ABC transporter permease subunit [Lederbergia wuyishanensis]MCJ8008395.1 ABC transporter permease subunit [Lederbergia wuyishanensis]MDQ0343812.1 putative aldouronate transport system permease protein [Lederbergia wuyishanensis]
MEAKTVTGKTVEIKSPRKSTWEQVKRMKLLYVMLLFPAIMLFIFNYLPMYGVIIAFKNFSPGLGIWDSPWNDFDHFKRLFTDFMFIRALKNTLFISILKIVIAFPAPIIFAILLNEIRNQKFLKVTQSISYLPHFMSWVILSAMIIEVFSPQRGIVNFLITAFGGDPVNFLASKIFFIPVLLLTDIWKEIGYGAIIYLATIASIDPALYEAAEMDGAGRFKKMIHITLPSIMPMVIILFILRLGGILNAGFDQILNLYNPLVYEVADIIDTYVYRSGLEQFQFDYATAVGLFKNVIGIIFILGANAIIRRKSEHGIW